RGPGRTQKSSEGPGRQRRGRQRRNGGSFAPAPFDQLQVEDEDRVERRHEQLGDIVGQQQAADLRVTEGFPQRPAVCGQRDQAEDGRADRDHHRAQARDAGVEQRLAQGFALFWVTPRKNEGGGGVGGAAGRSGGGPQGRG